MKKENKFKKWITKQGLDIWSLIKALLTLIGSTILFIPLGLLGLVYSLFKHLILMNFSLNKVVSPIIRGITLAVDGFGNSGAGELMNDILKPTVKFGKWYQTISAVVGINYLKYKELIKFRNILNKVFGKLHSEDAVQDNDRVYYNIKNN